MEAGPGPGVISVGHCFVTLSAMPPEALPPRSRTSAWASETVTKHHPDEIETHLSIAVDETVAHARDFAPGDFGMGGLYACRDLARRLAQNLQRSNGRVLMEPARKEGGFV
jgi:hypothetical protein